MTTLDSPRDSLEDSGFRIPVAILGALPLVSYLALVCYAAYAAVVTGHWPRYSFPDPPFIPHSAVGQVIVLAGFALIAAPVYAVVRLALCWDRSPALPPRIRWLDRSGIAAFFLGVILWLTASTRLLNWVLD